MARASRIHLSASFLVGALLLTACTQTPPGAPRRLSSGKEVLVFRSEMAPCERQQCLRFSYFSPSLDSKDAFEAELDDVAIDVKRDGERLGADRLEIIAIRYPSTLDPLLILFRRERGGGGDVYARLADGGWTRVARTFTASQRSRDEAPPNDELQRTRDGNAAASPLNSVLCGLTVGFEGKVQCEDD
jgi:hypothetical protein